MLNISLLLLTVSMVVNSIVFILIYLIIRKYEAKMFPNYDEQNYAEGNIEYNYEEELSKFDYAGIIGRDYNYDNPPQAVYSKPDEDGIYNIYEPKTDLTYQSGVEEPQE